MNTELKRIAVVGAAGQKGSSIVEALLEYPDQWIVRGIVRDRSLPFSQDFIRRGVEIIQCNINNREECCQAFADTYGVMAITNKIDAGSIGVYQQAVNLIEAARMMNVQHFVISLSPDISILTKDKHDLSSNNEIISPIEEYLRQLPIDGTFPHLTLIRIGFFYQSVLSFFVPSSSTPEFRYPGFLPGRIPFYDAYDTGKVVCQCFLHPERFPRDQVVPIVAEILTLEELQAIIRTYTTKPVKFVPLTHDEAFRKLLRHTVKIMWWHHDFGKNDQQQIAKTKEIYPNMKSFAQWFEEIARTMDW